MSRIVDAFFMSLPILQTKLYVPKHQRQRNVVSLTAADGQARCRAAGKVTLISAPAGFGKSTLLREWIVASQSQPEEASEGAAALVKHVAWLTLDADDNDPARFLLHSIASLRTFDPIVGESAWSQLQSPELPAPKAILTLLLNDLSLLASEEDEPNRAYVLVLEDYHLITVQAIHEALSYLIDNMPPHLHVVITTRADPPLPFARWRTRYQLAEIRAADLRFTADEAAAFLNQHMGLQLSSGEVTALEQRTEGWIAGFSRCPSRCKVMLIKRISYRLFRATTAMCSTIWSRKYSISSPAQCRSFCCARPYLSVCVGRCATR